MGFSLQGTFCKECLKQAAVGTKNVVAEYIENYGDGSAMGLLSPELAFKVAVGAPVAVACGAVKHVITSDRCKHGSRAPQPLEPISIDDL